MDISNVHFQVQYNMYFRKLEFQVTSPSTSSHQEFILFSMRGHQSLSKCTLEPFAS